MRIERVIKEKTWKRGVRKEEVYRERFARKRIEVRIIGCNKVEFMAPKGSETRTNLTSFFYLAQYLKLNCTVLILYYVESTCKILCHRL